jgi:hypothetical protein
MQIENPKRVPQIQQVTDYDCWHASIRMMVKWKHGDDMEPKGTYTEWHLDKCKEAEKRASKRQVPGYAKELSLFASNTPEKPFKPFYNRPGMTSALLPTILAENKLRGLRGTWLHNGGNKEMEPTFRTMISRLCWQFTTWYPSKRACPPRTEPEETDPHHIPMMLARSLFPERRNLITFTPLKWQV